MYSPIESFIENHSDLYNAVSKENKNISILVNINEHYRKILLLSCASFYETKIINLIKEYVKSNTDNGRIIELINNKALNRQYHTFFDWNGRNINHFLGLFGNDFKEKISNDLKSNDDLNECIRAFLEIGSERNKMVHENFLDYKLDKTWEEIVELHNKAIRFIEYLNSIF